MRVLNCLCSITKEQDMSSVKHGKRLYKQMSLEVAVRNPERYIDFVRVFSKYEGRTLDDKCILEIYIDLYLQKVIEANGLTDENLNVSFLEKYIKENNTHNNEWGFPTGYQAAFCRYLKTLSEFGFIYSQYNEPLKISDVSKKMLNGEISLSEAFALQSMKFWRKSPYRRVLNDFNYFKFVMEAIIKLDSMNKKMSYNQFLVSLFSINGSVDDYLTLITENRIGSDRDKAYELVYSLNNRTTPEYGKVAKQDSAFRDFGNTVFRVLQLTGFITVESVGIITITPNKNRMDFYKELKEFDFKISEEAKESEEKYFDELGVVTDEQIAVIAKYREKEDKSTLGYNEKIKDIFNKYKLTQDYVGNYLLDISNDKKDKKCFWFMQSPLKLEFLLTLYVYSCYGEKFEYKPNYKCDDNGIPYSHAPGNTGDIEVFNKDIYWLIEATLIQNKNQQINSETMNLFRHIALDKKGKKYMLLVAPYIHQDTELMIKVASLIVSIEKRQKIYSGTTDIKSFLKTTRLQNNFDVLEGVNEELINTIKEYVNSYNS